MSHREDKKEAKRGSNKSVKPQVIREEEIQKESTQGVIKSK